MKEVYDDMYFFSSAPDQCSIDLNKFQVVKLSRISIQTDDWNAPIEL